MAQVSCELVAPKENRPNEGIMFFNIELSPLASPAFEQGRWEQTEETAYFSTNTPDRFYVTYSLLYTGNISRHVIRESGGVEGRETRTVSETRFI